jgi:hypothetical protein
VQASLEDFFTENDWLWDSYPPRKIFVTGESGDIQELFNILQEVCSRRGNTPMTYKEDVLFMAAKGTAELGKRADYLDWRDMHPPYETPSGGRDHMALRCYAFDS